MLKRLLLACAFLGVIGCGYSEDEWQAQLRRYDELLAEHQREEKEAEATRLRSTQIGAKVQDIRRRRFTDRLFERVPEAYVLKTWQDAPGQIVTALWQAVAAVTNWWTLEAAGDTYLVLFVTILMGIALSYAARRGVREVRIWKGEDQPPFWRRGAGAAWLILLRALPVAAPVAFLYFGLHGQDLLGARRVVGHQLLGAAQCAQQRQQGRNR